MAGRQAGRQAVKTPTLVLEMLTVLRAERAPLAARLDTLDLAIANLERLFPPAPEPMVRRVKFIRRGQKSVKPTRSADDLRRASAAQARRDELLAVINKSDVGLTIADLRKAFPKLGSKDRSNALFRLKADGAIRRAGNAWVRAA
jgi:hypothetical protein